jgi:hypothetical protein
MKLADRGHFSMWEKCLYVAGQILASYGDAIVETTGEIVTGRTWDCSYFIARLLRAITGVDGLYKAGAIEQAVTAMFLSYCSARPAALIYDLPLLFLYDRDSMAFPQKTVHVAVAMPSLDFYSMCMNTTGEVLEDIIVLDMYVNNPAPPDAHRASEWFNATPLHDVAVMPFAGNAAPAFPGGTRYVVSPAFFNVRQALKIQANRG